MQKYVFSVRPCQASRTYCGFRIQFSMRPCSRSAMTATSCWNMSITAFLDFNRGERLLCTAQWPKAKRSPDKSAIKFPSLSLSKFSMLSMAFSFGISGPNGTSELVNQLWPGQCAMNFGKLHQRQVQAKKSNQIKNYQKINPQDLAEGLSPGRPLQFLHLKILGKIGKLWTCRWMIQRVHITHLKQLCRHYCLLSLVRRRLHVCGFKCAGASAAVGKSS